MSPPVSEKFIIDVALQSSQERLTKHLPLSHPAHLASNPECMTTNLYRKQNPS
jgi:hypothetical protein